MYIYIIYYAWMYVRHFAFLCLLGDWLCPHTTLNRICWIIDFYSYHQLSFGLSIFTRIINYFLDYRFLLILSIVIPFELCCVCHIWIFADAVKFRSSFSLRISSGGKLSWLMRCLSWFIALRNSIVLTWNPLSNSQVMKVNLVLVHPVN